MLIKQQALLTHLQQHKLAALYILFGQDHFLLNTAAESIYSAWQTANNNGSEKTILYLDSPTDWALLEEEATSYSLFAHYVFIDIRYEKKTIDTNGKAFFSNYLQNINPSCLLLLRAPNLTQKQLQGLITHQQVHLIQANALNNLGMQKWIIEQLKKNALHFEQPVPALIHQYTQGNLLACAQVIEKIKLVAEENVLLTTEFVREQLVDQCNYQLFELADVCLSQNPDKVIQLLRHAYHSKIEPSLILWLLAQEIRLLIRLIELIKQSSLNFNSACSQLKIWPHRIKLYESALKKMQLSILIKLLQFCNLIDERIKSNQSNQIWQALEQLALSFCLAKQVGNFA